jgi:uncharacterized protein (DUF58 family)
VSSRFRLTPSGTALGVGVVLLTLLALITAYRELVVLAFAALLLLVLVFLLPRIASAIQLQRIALPHLVQRGALAEVVLRARADGVVPPVRIIDQLAGVAVPIDLPQIQANVPITVRYRIQAVRRGVHKVGPLLEERSDPFGLIVRTIHHDVIDDMLVHPVIHRLQLPTGGVRHRERSNLLPRVSADPLADFRTLREYVPGDDPRLVHWASTARTGSLVVKDHFELRRAMRLVVIETFEATITEPLFEEAAEIAASMCIDALVEGIQVIVRTRDTTAPGRLAPVRDRNEVLELFARVRRTPGSSTLSADRVRPLGQDADQIYLVAGASSPLIDGFITNAWTRHRLVVVRISDHPAELPRLPVRTIDVRSAEDFVARWRLGWSS